MAPRAGLNTLLEEENFISAGNPSRIFGCRIQSLDILFDYAVDVEIL
jgi:hypothetical protein